VSEVVVLPLTRRIGAEVRGVHLDPDLDPATAAAIHDAWLRHKVIFFRDQGHLDDHAQEGLAWIFGGEAAAHPTVPSADGTDFVYELDSKVGAASYWHTDLTWWDSLPRGAILRAVVIPPSGGDTLWANTATAYADLPPRLRARADQAWAVHSNGSRHGGRRRAAKGEDETRQEFWSAFQSTVFETRHPVVHLHPETHEPCLLLGRFTRRLIGMSRARSDRLYMMYQWYITRPENTMRWRWSVGDVAVWDNRSTQHYAVADYGDDRRVMHRVSIDGEPTVGLDGRRAWTTSHDGARARPAGRTRRG
jgi:taurine dioxygenase